jgi:hypothetical protein
MRAEFGDLKDANKPQGSKSTRMCFGCGICGILRQNFAELRAKKETGD